MNKKLQITTLKKIFQKNGFDTDTIDFDALVDGSLTLTENITLLKEKYDFLREVDVEALETQALQHYIDITEKEERETFKSLPLDKSKKLQKIFKNADEWIKLTAKKHNFGLVLVGKGGMGKSYRVFQTLKSIGFEKDRDYELLSGYSTPLEFYNFLYKNRDKLIVLDDLNGLFEDTKAISLLKSALWGTAGKRFISYQTTSEKLRVPSKFVFEGSIIFICNELPNNKEIESLLTRCVVLNFNFSRKQILEILHEIASQGYGSLSKQECLEVFKFIREKTDLSTTNLNIRTLVKALKLREALPKSWEVLALDLFKDDIILRQLLDIIRNYPTAKERIKAFIERTGKSRATYYNYLAKYNLNV